ncbi:hypothetical protein ABK040_015793 [Willaertia magna]
MASVTLNDITCQFQFSTISCKELAEEKKKLANGNPNNNNAQQAILLPYEKVLERLPKSGCLKKVEGYWTYDFCFNEQVTQSHGSQMKFNLGKFTEFKKEKALFVDGDICELPDKNTNNNNGNVPGGKKREVKRRTNVIFMCGQSSEIVNVKEPIPCEYEFIVTDPNLCSENSPFPKYTHETDMSSILAINNPYDNFEMKIEKTMFVNEYLCTVQSILRDLKPVPNTCFKYFSIQMITTNNDNNMAEKNKAEKDDEDKDGSGERRGLVARAMHHGRIPFENKELKYVRKGREVRSTKYFTGSLDYIQIK